MAYNNLSSTNKNLVQFLFLQVRNKMSLKVLSNILKEKGWKYYNSKILLPTLKI